MTRVRAYHRVPVELNVRRHLTTGDAVAAERHRHTKGPSAMWVKVTVSLSRSAFSPLAEWHGTGRRRVFPPSLPPTHRTTDNRCWQHKSARSTHSSAYIYYISTFSCFIIPPYIARASFISLQVLFVLNNDVFYFTHTKW